MSLSAKGMHTSDVIKRLKAGETVLCPECDAPLAPLPAAWQEGVRLEGVKCSSHPSHYEINIPENPQQVMKDLLKRLNEGNPRYIARQKQLDELYGDPFDGKP